ncbi:hypothetical protein BH10ACT3_BH10ACT3_06100 [soil metagenome]
MSTDPSRVAPSLAERQPIRVDDVPWQEFLTADGASTGVFTKSLVDPESGNVVMMARFPPNHRARPHWHLSPMLYITTAGEFIVDGERSYFAGDLRWVRGGYSYGSEGAGPEGCEFYVMSLGPYGQFYPEEHTPPHGRWDDHDD